MGQKQLYLYPFPHGSLLFKRSLTGTSSSSDILHISSSTEFSLSLWRWPCFWTNDTYFIDFVCGVLFYGTHVYSYAQNVGMPIIGVPGCLMKPVSVPVKFPFSVKKNIRILDLDPRTEAYCLSLNSVCFKRLPRKKYFHLLNSYNIKRVLGVVYC